MCYEYQHHEFLNWIFGSFIESLRGDALAWSPRVNVIGVSVNALIIIIIIIISNTRLKGL
jgi:hypothetical protein